MKKIILCTLIALCNSSFVAMEKPKITAEQYHEMIDQYTKINGLDFLCVDDCGFPCQHKNSTEKLEHIQQEVQKLVADFSKEKRDFMTHILVSSSPANYLKTWFDLGGLPEGNMQDGRSSLAMVLAVIVNNFKYSKIGIEKIKVVLAHPLVPLNDIKHNQSMLFSLQNKAIHGFDNTQLKHTFHLLLLLLGQPRNGWGDSLSQGCNFSPAFLGRHENLATICAIKEIALYKKIMADYAEVMKAREENIAKAKATQLAATSAKKATGGSAGAPAVMSPLTATATAAAAQPQVPDAKNAK